MRSCDLKEGRRISVNFFGEIGFLFGQIFMRPIFNGLVLLYHLFGDFGLSIVVLTLIIRLLLFPLTLKQLKSMKANQQLQPQMQEIRKKYAKDQQAQVQALQALYKEYGVSPLTGCLPSLAQLPVIYGLYFALYSVVNAEKAHNIHSLNDLLYQPFVRPFSHLPNLSFTWFQWLSFLNPILHVNLSWTLSLIQPDPSHILPVLAALATLISLRISQPATAAAAAANNSKNKPGQPDQSMQMMKTMQLIMPIMILYFGWNFPAGLVLYWIVSSGFQAIQQYFVTGWGSLLTVPNLIPKKEGSLSSHNGTASTKISPDDSIREKAGFQRTEQVDSETDENEGKSAHNGSVASNVRSSTTTQLRTNGSYSSSRRQRGGSASARRRGGSQRSRR
jgi:YidC/Oxa1 family membrane protein insertase